MSRVTYLKKQSQLPKMIQESLERQVKSLQQLPSSALPKNLGLKSQGRMMMMMMMMMMMIMMMMDHRMGLIKDPNLRPPKIRWSSWRLVGLVSQHHAFSPDEWRWPKSDPDFSSNKNPQA